MHERLGVRGFRAECHDDRFPDAVCDPVSLQQRDVNGSRRDRPLRRAMRARRCRRRRRRRRSVRSRALPGAGAGRRAGGENHACDSEQRDEHAAADEPGGRSHRTRVSDSRMHQLPPRPYELKVTGSRRVVCTAGSSLTSRSR